MPKRITVLLLACSLSVGAAAQASVDPNHASMIHALAVGGKAGRIGQIVKRDGYVTTFNASSPGKFEITWFTVRKGKPTPENDPITVAYARTYAAAAGPLRVTIHLVGRAHKLLRHVRRIKLTARAGYSPAGAVPTTATRTITLKR